MGQCTSMLFVCTSLQWVSHYDSSGMSLLVMGANNCLDRGFVRAIHFLFDFFNLAKPLSKVIEQNALYCITA